MKNIMVFLVLTAIYHKGTIDNDVLLSLNVAISILEVLDYTSNHHIEFNKYYKF